MRTAHGLSVHHLLFPCLNAELDTRICSRIAGIFVLVSNSLQSRRNIELLSPTSQRLVTDCGIELLSGVIKINTLKGCHHLHHHTMISKGISSCYLCRYHLNYYRRAYQWTARCNACYCSHNNLLFENLLLQRYCFYFSSCYKKSTDGALFFAKKEKSFS